MVGKKTILAAGLMAALAGNAEAQENQQDNTQNKTEALSDFDKMRMKVMALTMGLEKNAFKGCQKVAKGTFYYGDHAVALVPDGSKAKKDSYLAYMEEDGLIHTYRVQYRRKESKKSVTLDISREETGRKVRLEKYSRDFNPDAPITRVMNGLSVENENNLGENKTLQLPLEVWQQQASHYDNE